MDTVKNVAAPPQPFPAGNPAEPAVMLRTAGLTRSFGAVHAVESLDLSVYGGEIYGFLGVNGAGKTTTIRMLMGIIKPDRGSIELLGQRARRISIQQKQSIGYVAQEQTFYSWMTCRALGQFVGGLYPSWDASEFDRLLRVLELPSHRKVSQLSHGMRMKLALALALAPRPPLLILDEPTAGLDPVARREFLDFIDRQAHDERRTTFFSSHLIDEVERVADRVGIIHRGRMRYEGRLDTLRASVRRLRFPTTASAPPPAPPIDAPAAAPPPPALTDSLSTAAAVTLPPGFEVLRDETRDGVRTLVVHAPAASWRGFVPPAGAELTRLPLEDIFIALVGRGAPAE
jgi:ABC-2 type transport system ATP-binding protein